LDKPPLGRLLSFLGPCTPGRRRIVPSTGTVAILLTQVAMDDPVAPAIMRDFWQHAAG
jgi:hypothetical protein